jgi:amino acid transporter
VLWGLITAGICNLALAASLAEMLSAYPTAGGQYVSDLLGGNTHFETSADML